MKGKNKMERIDYVDTMMKSIRYDVKRSAQQEAYQLIATEIKRFEKEILKAKEHLKTLECEYKEYIDDHTDELNILCNILWNHTKK